MTNTKGEISAIIAAIQAGESMITSRDGERRVFVGNMAKGHYLCMANIDGVWSEVCVTDEGMKAYTFLANIH